jgi:hypothetical protein
MKKLVLTISLLIYACSYGQELVFKREDITFRLSKKYLSVEGYYWFTNNTSKDVHGVIYFPYGDDDKTGPVDSIEIYKMPEGKIIQYYTKDNPGFYFELNIPAKDSAICRIKYRQKVIADSAKYILLSTKTWKAPLEAAEYKLIIDKDIIIKRFSYIPDKEYTVNGEKIYYWKKNNFMPERDMIFCF